MIFNQTLPNGKGTCVFMKGFAYFISDPNSSNAGTKLHSSVESVPLPSENNLGSIGALESNTEYNFHHRSNRKKASNSGPIILKTDRSDFGKEKNYFNLNDFGHYFMKWTCFEIK